MLMLGADRIDTGRLFHIACPETEFIIIIVIIGGT
jgi:hypothetical protein